MRVSSRSVALVEGVDEVELVVASPELCIRSKWRPICQQSTVPLVQKKRLDEAILGADRGILRAYVNPESVCCCGKETLFTLFTVCFTKGGHHTTIDLCVTSTQLAYSPVPPP